MLDYRSVGKIEKSMVIFKLFVANFQEFPYKVVLLCFVSFWNIIWIIWVLPKHWFTGDNQGLARSLK